MRQIVLSSLFMFMFLVMACKNDGVPVEGTDKNFKLEYLLTVDGCKVYRFWDGRWVYTTTCMGSVGAYYGCGKNCSRWEGVDTNEAVPGQ